MDLPLWKSVPETERREIFSDVVHNLAKKEKVGVRFLPSFFPFRFFFLRYSFSIEVYDLRNLALYE